MARDKANRLTAHMTQLGVISHRNRGRAATATGAQCNLLRWVWFVAPTAQAAVVAADKTKGLALNLTQLGIIALGERRGFAASAFAELGNRKFHFELLWIMLVHVVSASNAIGQAAGCFQQRRGASVVLVL